MSAMLIAGTNSTDAQQRPNAQETLAAQAQLLDVAATSLLNQIDIALMATADLVASRLAARRPARRPISSAK
jgi:hypothetical protein